jgi:predicted AAA+ superfamily ATPase
LIKLTQSMGGGKTHNMIALGLLAKYPEFRARIMGDRFKDSHLGKIKVVAFTGRESDAPYGIWGAIAEQLGKKEVFKDYYSPSAGARTDCMDKPLKRGTLSYSIG